MLLADDFNELILIFWKLSLDLRNLAYTQKKLT